MNPAATTSLSPIQESEFRSDINALRAIAVLAVMGFHFGVPGFSGGFAGVDVFFVISGFLITSQILSLSERNSFSFIAFYGSRVRRIFPALLVVVVVCLVWGWFFYLPKEYINTNRHAASALFFVSNIAFDGERGYFDSAAYTKALLHTWSLAIEVQFYLFLPVFLVALRRLFSRYLVFFVGLSLLILGGWALYFNHIHPGKGFYLLSSRAWELLIGCVLAAWRIPKLATAVSSSLSLIGVLLLGGSFSMIDAAVPWPGIWTLIPTFATAAIISAGNTSVARSILASKPFQHIGDISYSLYLWHWPIWVFANNLASMFGHDLFWLDRLIMVFFSFILANLSWKYVEQPVRKQRQFWTNARVIAFALAGALLVFCFGLANVVVNGMPFRFPTYIQRAADATFINTPRDECFRRGDSTKDAPDQFCRFGVSGTMDPELMLWGDSHANQYLTAISDAAIEGNSAGLIATQSACSARIIDANAAEKSPCEKFDEEVYQFLVNHESVKIVILGKWWPNLQNDSFLDLVRDLTKRGRKVIVVGALPSPGFDVPDRWSKQQMNAGHAIDSMDVPLSSQSLALKIREQTLAQLEPLIQSGLVIYIDPLKKLCDETVCHLVENGYSNFRDESHLSHSRSVQFAPEFKVAIGKMKAGSE